MNVRIHIVAPLFAVIALLGCQSNEPKVQSADLVLTNGKIYTMDPSQPWVDGVAIENGVILARGTSQEMARYSAAEVIDLDGRMAMPGLFDAHQHPMLAGATALYSCVFGFTDTPEQVAQALQGCVAKKPDGEWIRGGQWGSNFFEMYDLESPRALLDSVSGDYAVVLNDDAWHNVWVNSKALELAGIDAGTPSPAGGEIVKGPGGEPNGVLLETAAQLVSDVMPMYNEEEQVASATYAMQAASGFGVVGIKDAGAFGSVAPAFQMIDQAGEIQLHAAVCMETPFGHRTEVLDYDDLERRRDQYRSTNVHTHFVKLFLDGVPTPARTAAMVEPYLPDEKHGDNYTGSLHLNPEMVIRDVVELDKRGFTIKMHAAGDRSVRVALDAIEAARKANGDSGLRHELAHAGYIADSDLRRFAELNAVADYSPYIWHPSPIIDAVLAAVGPERGPRYWPTRDLLASGAHIAPGSDWPAAVPSMNPWVGMEALVTRRDPYGMTDGALWEEQAIDVATAMRLFTLGGANALRLADVSGSIEPGKFADIIVLDRNLFEISPDQIGKTQVELTLFKGDVVFEK